MSIIKELFPLCDVCKDTFPDFRGHESIKDLRDNMKAGGWINKKGKDICPDCQQKGSD
jgi:hypothetical protein